MIKVSFFFISIRHNSKVEEHLNLQTDLSSHVGFWFFLYFQVNRKSFRAAFAFHYKAYFFLLL